MNELEIKKHICRKCNVEKIWVEFPPISNYNMNYIVCKKCKKKSPSEIELLRRRFPIKEGYKISYKCKYYSDITED